MKTYRNTTDRFGDSVKFEAENELAAADQVKDLLMRYAQDAFDAAESEDPANVDGMSVEDFYNNVRDEFIAELEEVDLKIKNDKNLGLVILDNGGGITLQMGDFAHHYDDSEQAAADLSAWLVDSDTSDWDGHEDDAMDCDPSGDDIRNGGYRIIRLDRDVDTCESLAKEIAGKCDWGNAGDLAASLSALANA